MILFRSFLSSCALRPSIFSLLVVSALASKALVLYLHLGVVNGLLIALYFPTFFILEGLLFTGVWYLFQRSAGLKYVVGTVVSGFLTVITYFAASSEFAFYFVTGSEVDWDAATSVGSDPEGLKLMLSGLTPCLWAAFALLIAAFLLAPGINLLMTWWWSSISSMAAYVPVEQLPMFNIGGQLRKWLMRLNFVGACTMCLALSTLGLWLIRPPVPFNHMSRALPFSVFWGFVPHHHGPPPPDGFRFPFPWLLAKEFWEPARDHYKGWAPRMGPPHPHHHRPPPPPPEEGDANVLPEWATRTKLPSGFVRWAAGERGSDAPENYTTHNFYNPVTDPLRITNLDLEVLEPLSQTFKEHDVLITHIVMVMMESARKDIFPFKYGSHLYKQILESYGTNNGTVIEELNFKLSRMTPFAEILTGESSGFPSTVNDHEGEQEEEHNTPAGSGFGGINVNGVVTGSSFSCKSVLVDHCGVSPLPIEWMGEVRQTIYQPCIMQILKLFNRLKEDSSANSTVDNTTTFKDVHERKWRTYFAQSTTGEFGEEAPLTEQMGFDKAIFREDLADPTAPYYHSGMEKVNYFGYPEHELYPYMRDMINDTLSNGDRIFLSHFTGSTHHPWGVPRKFPTEQYFPEGSLYSKHEDLNAYLNTVRYVDSWLGDVMKLLNESGIANETLIVLVGDHGQAFVEDSQKTGTYENGHISNFRIPLVFYHPLLPRFQLAANASSMSIVPTILDLLINTRSLNDEDTDVALDLINEYEGQSLLRPYKNIHNGRQAWHFGIINTGGTMLSVGSAAAPFRLIVPLNKEKEYTFTNLDNDPYELHMVKEFDLHQLVKLVRQKYGEDAARWVADADRIGKWWVNDRKRLYNYHD